MTENEKVKNINADEEMKPVEQSASEAKPDEILNSAVGAETLDELSLLKIENENLKRELDEYKDRFLRRVAEFENYKKRLEADFANSIKYANEKLLLEILPIVDDLERSLSSGKEKPDFDSFYQGVKIIYAKLLKVLELHGVKPFESIGKPFDVYYHEALLRIPRSDVPPNTVIDEVERGYMYYDKVLRHAKVIVSSPIENSEKKEENEKSSGFETNFGDDHKGI